MREEMFMDMTYIMMVMLYIKYFLGRLSTAKTSSYWYRDYHYKHDDSLRQPYVYNGDSYTREMTSYY